MHLVQTQQIYRILDNDNQTVGLPIYLFVSVLCVVRMFIFLLQKKLNVCLRHQIKRSADRKYWFKIA